MSDLISRQAAIDALDFEKVRMCAYNTETGENEGNLFEKYNKGLDDGIKAIKSLPSAQPETHEERTETHACDLISRQAAIDAILAVTGNSSVRELYEHVQEHGLSDMWSGGVNAAIDIIIAVPSAQPDSKELSGTHKALDTVSRQAVIEAINKIFPADPMHDDYTQGITCGAALANIYVAQLPSAQPEHTNSWYINSWCIDCKEYDTENKCCPRYNRVIKQTLDDAYRHGETEAEARFHAQQRWIPCSERLPENIRPVIVTWKNTDPASYYQYIVGKHFTGTACYKNGKWYWYSSTTEDMLSEYGRYDSEEFDEAIECIAWMPLPEPYAERRADG